MDKNRENFNQVMRGYIVLHKKKIDLCPVSCPSHPLHDYVSKTVQLTQEQASTFLGAGNVVFDPVNTNFHVFPEASKTRKSLSKSILDLRSKIATQLEYYNITVGGKGSIGRINAFKDENGKTIPVEYNGMYRFIQVIREGKNLDGGMQNFVYSIFFSRYTFNGTVGSSMEKIQFWKEPLVGETGNSINKNKDRLFEIGYTESDKDFAYCVTSAGNVCFNPPVDFSKPNEIAEHFLFFVEHQGNIFGEIKKEDLPKTESLKKKDYETKFKMFNP